MPANCAGASGPSPASPATANTATSTPDLVTLLTRRAGDDPAWWGVIRQYALGHARWPDPFQPRKPKPPASHP